VELLGPLLMQPGGGIPSPPTQPTRKNNNGNKDYRPQGRKRSSKGAELIQHWQGIEDSSGKRLDAST